MDGICSEPWEKSPRGLSDAAQMRGAQRLKGRRSYSLYKLLICSYYTRCLMETVVLVGLFLLRRDSLSPPHPNPVQTRGAQRTQSFPGEHGQRQNKG